MINKNIQTFCKASIISFFTGITITGLSVMFGKENLFLLLNNNLGVAGDYFFKYITYLGDGIIWIPFLLWIAFKNRERMLVSIATLVFSTIIAQGIKRFILPVQPRPIVGIKDLSQIHLISGVEVAEVGSFPSGHTTQIFAMFLLLCLMYNNSKALWFGFITALLVAYSRVYQAQHFPIDLAGGIAAALISVWLSYFVQMKFVRNNAELSQ